MFSVGSTSQNNQLQPNSVPKIPNVLPKIIQLLGIREPNDLYEQLTKLLIPDLADLVAIDLRDNLGHWYLAFLKHQDPSKEALARKLRQIFPIDSAGSDGVLAAVKTGKSEFYPQITGQMLEEITTNKSHLVILRQANFNSIIIVPIEAQGRILGALSLIMADSNRTYLADDLEQAEEVGRLLGLAQENIVLNEKLTYLTAIFQSSQDSIITKDLNGILTGWNPASERIYGYTSEEIIGQPITILFPPKLKNDFGNIMGKLKRGERIENFDTLRMRKDGSIFPVSVSISPIINLEGKVTGACGIGRDITDRIELEKRKDDFISIASHELKTPLTTLKGFSQILLHYSSRIDPQLNGFINRMDNQIDKLNVLVSDLLDVSRIKFGKVNLKKEKFKIDELISQITSDMQYSSTQHQLILDLQADCMVKADKYRLGQVLTNLISNAIKYSPQADKVIILSCIVKKGVEVSIKDFGIGILPKDQKKVFEHFYQAKNKIRESSSGLGLGLFISAEIIDRHKGHIEMESVKGKGSVFRFWIPK